MPSYILGSLPSARHGGNIFGTGFAETTNWDLPDDMSVTQKSPCCEVEEIILFAGYTTWGEIVL